MQRPPSWNSYNAGAFQLEDVVRQYHLRHPYPSTLAPFLLDLATPKGAPVLELGCGTGEIARALAPHVERIDAIDISPRMIECARTMPGGDHPAIRWTVGRAEDAPLKGPYALAVAGASLHWMDWDTVLPRIARQLAPGAVLAIVVSREVPAPWADALREIISRYSTIQNWQNADLMALLESRGVFKHIAKEHLAPEPHSRTIDEYVDGQHATSALARERMGADRARSFDDEVRALVSPYARDGMLELAAGAEVDRGTPIVP
jgi:ubiquinone/menaquinone biosynthesis C-methylase UbiE